MNFRKAVKAFFAALNAPEPVEAAVTVDDVRKHVRDFILSGEMTRSYNAAVRMINEVILARKGCKGKHVCVVEAIHADRLVQAYRDAGWKASDPLPPDSSNLTSFVLTLEPINESCDASRS